MRRREAIAQYRKFLRSLHIVQFGDFCPSLDAMFGSTIIRDRLVSEIEAGVTKGTATPELRDRVEKLRDHYIPQIAQLNSLPLNQAADKKPHTHLNQPPSRGEINAFISRVQAMHVARSHGETYTVDKIGGEHFVFLRIIYHSLSIVLDLTTPKIGGGR